MGEYSSCPYEPSPEGTPPRHARKKGAAKAPPPGSSSRSGVCLTEPHRLLISTSAWLVFELGEDRDAVVVHVEDVAPLGEVGCPSLEHLNQPEQSGRPRLVVANPKEIDLC